MKEKELAKLLDKAEELKVVGFLEEVISFVREMKPILDSMNSNIADNLIKMPAASKKLAQVTEATEVATTEIMNTIDSIIEKTGKINKNLTDIESGAGNDTISESKSLLCNIDDDANSIMMALQVQDITSQQIAAVNKVLDTVKSRLSSILNNFEMSSIKGMLDEYNEEKGIQTSTLHREIAFDPNAVEAITNKANRQSEVDDLIDRIGSGEEISIEEVMPQSNDDIDALIASLADEISEVQDGTFSENAISADVEEFSQDDIDALFAQQ